MKRFNTFLQKPKDTDEDANLHRSILSEEQRSEVFEKRKSELITETIDVLKKESPSLGFESFSVPVPRGERGNDGVPGTRGPAGKSGKDGLLGSQGEQGIEGEQGIQGEKGIQGEQGEHGEPGVQGEQGLRGEAGEKGIEGEQGIQGEKGIQGVQGVQGEQGEQGVLGEQGPEGKKGKQGTKGLKGEKGPKGIKGDRGIPGKVGPPGIVGKDGKDGEDGKAGEIGDDGIVVAQFPLKYDKDRKKISVDTKVLQKMLSVPPAQAQNIDWVALAGGGAVGVRDRTESNDIYLLKSVSDLIFKGTGVALERKGKDIELTFTDTGTYNESTTPPSSPSDGDRWHETDSGKLFTYSNTQSAWIEF